MTSNADHITILYFADMRQRTGRNEEQLPLPQAQSALEIYQALQKKYNLPDTSSLRVAVNHRFCDWQHRIHAGDILALIPPVEGG